MFYKFFNKLQLNYKHKKKFFFFPIKKSDTEIIQILIKYNLIKYVKKNKRDFIIFLKYINNTNIFELINFYKPSNIQYISHKTLIKLNNNNHILLLSTSNGIITSIDAIKKKIGGILVAKIIL